MIIILGMTRVNPRQLQSAVSYTVKRTSGLQRNVPVCYLVVTRNVLSPDCSPCCHGRGMFYHHRTAGHGAEGVIAA